MRVRTLIVVAAITALAGAFTGKVWGDVQAHDRFPVAVQYTFVTDDGTDHEQDVILAPRAEADVHVDRLLQARGERPHAIFVCEITEGGERGYLRRNLEGCDDRFISNRWREYRQHHPYSATRDAYNMIFGS